MTRSFLIDVSLHAFVWLDVVYAAIFTINRLPTPVLLDKSPYKVLFIKVPNYQFKKQFGCTCFPHFITSVNKLLSRSGKCVFLDYAPYYKGYRCPDPLTNRIYITHDVCFHKSDFPYASLAHQAPFVHKFTSFVLEDVLSLTHIIDVVAMVPCSSCTFTLPPSNCNPTSRPSGLDHSGPISSPSLLVSQPPYCVRGWPIQNAQPTSTCHGHWIPHSLLA